MTEPLTNPSPRQIARLKKNVSPTTQTSISGIGSDILQNNDPVLLYLALSDEREYERMIETDSAISGAIEQRINGLTAQGWEVEIGMSQSAEARKYADFMEQVFLRMRRFGTLRREVLRSIYYGWRPVWLDWTTEFDFDGRPHFAVEFCRAKPPWEYEFTVAGDLVFTGQIQPIVYSDPVDKLHWMICTAGTTDSLYGHSWLRRLWMLFFLSKKFEKMSAQAMQRALGIVKAKQQGGQLGGLGGRLTETPKEEEVIAEIAKVMKALNAHNVLMETQGWSLEFITDVGLTEAHDKMMSHFDTKKRQAIVLQNLTSEIKGFGSRAAAETHAEILRSVWISDATEESDWYTEGLILPMLQLNFENVRPQDVPRFRSGVFSRPDQEETRLAYEMGLPIDGRRLAHSWRVPAALPEDGSDVVLEKPEPNVLQVPLGQQGDKPPREEGGGGEDND
jgi:hypothetical protein